jgi:hypothetical protein
MGLARFMASPLGRGLRIVVGFGLVLWGLGGVGGVPGRIIAIVGLLPLTLGVINGCILAPFLHVPFRGADLPKS